MYVVDAVRLLFRRWLVVALGLAATAAGCNAVLDHVDREYQASSQMLFILPPEASGIETPSNPYLNLQEGLTTTASLVAGTISTKDVQRQLATAGFDAEYAISVLPGAGPLLVITATSTEPAVAIATRDEVMLQVDRVLAELQTAAAVPARQLMTATRSSVSQNAEVLPGRRLRAVAGAGGAGMLLTLLLAFVVDRLLSQRRARRLAAAQDEAAGADRPDDEGTRSEPVAEPEPAPRPAATTASKARPVSVRPPAARGRPRSAGTTKPASAPARKGRNGSTPADLSSVDAKSTQRAQAG